MFQICTAHNCSSNKLEDLLATFEQVAGNVLFWNCIQFGLMSGQEIVKHFVCSVLFLDLNDCRKFILSAFTTISFSDSFSELSYEIVELFIEMQFYIDSLFRTKPK